MSFFGFSATFGGKILWKSIMEDTYIKKIHTSQVGGAKLLNLGKKCHFWLFLSPETQSYTILIINTQDDLFQIHSKIHI